MREVEAKRTLRRKRYAERAEAKSSNLRVGSDQLKIAKGEGASAPS